MRTIDFFQVAAGIQYSVVKNDRLGPDVFVINPVFHSGILGCSFTFQLLRRDGTVSKVCLVHVNLNHGGEVIVDPWKEKVCVFFKEEESDDENIVLVAELVVDFLLSEGQWAPKN